MSTRRLLLVVAAAVALTVGGFAAAAPRSGSPVGRAWVDDPLTGLTVAPGAVVDVLAHATDQGGVNAVRLDVDGTEIATVTTDAARLVLARFAWTAAGEGAHTLTVRGRSGGSWGTPGSTTVFVVAGAPAQAAPPEPAAGPDAGTPTPSTTAAPSAPGPSGPAPAAPPPASVGPPPPPPPCTAGVPTSLSDDAPANPPTLSWVYTDPCAAQSFVVVITDPDGNEISGTVSGTSWTPRAVFVPGIPYRWKVAAVHDGVQGPFSAVDVFFVR